MSSRNMLGDCTELIQSRMAYITEYFTNLLKVVNEPKEPFGEIIARWI